MKTVIPCEGRESSSRSSVSGLSHQLVVDAVDTPLIGPPPSELSLRHAPLVRAIAQLRFPLIASIEQRSFVAPFQEALRGDYPILRSEESRGIALGPSGLIGELPPNKLWRFNEVEGSWRVTLAPGFVALETSNYTNRRDFTVPRRSDRRSGPEPCRTHLQHLPLGSDGRISATVRR